MQHTLKQKLGRDFRTYVILGACRQHPWTRDTTDYLEPDMDDRIVVFPGPASVRLGTEVCEILRVAPAAYECRRFPDGETQIDVRESVRGLDVFLLQSTSPPVEQHLVELLLLADACRRDGAGRMTAVIPYFGYARQDRRSDRRSLGARVMADLIGTAPHPPDRRRHRGNRATAGAAPRSDQRGPVDCDRHSPRPPRRVAGRSPGARVAGERHDTHTAPSHVPRPRAL